MASELIASLPTLGSVLVWINGAFGSGKTQTTFEFLRRAPSAHVADPEEIGFAIHRMLPRAARNDFQHRPQWRSAVVATLADAVREHDGPVLVPMTLVERAYFDEIMSGLQAAGVDVRHFALIASPETLRRRLRTRSGFWLARATGRQETWAERQIERCVRSWPTITSLSTSTPTTAASTKWWRTLPPGPACGSSSQG